ncbi:MAG: phosphate ABC transporter substrate-binding protein PstS [Firmicutes bacterium]|nr:phosphate ABC transporter substrate-binding protein PstS [Bacillota bacterium]
MTIRKPFCVVSLILLMFSMFFSGCSGNKEGNANQNEAGKPVFLNGAGASFPYPLYSRWIHEYSRIESNVTINYQSIGSGAGIEQISKRVIDFGASDAPISDEKIQTMPGEIIHIPTAVGAVAITYNVPGLTQTLNFTPELLANIYLGKVTHWNDKELADINPGVNLPHRDILVVFRSDGSGTTNIFTDYLSRVNPAWEKQVGMGTSVQWPRGVGAKGSEGITRQVQSSIGSIGYVELTYALMNKIPVGRVQNISGRFVEPTLQSTSAAAASYAARMPDDLRVSIVNTPGDDTYPIAGYTYILLYREQDDIAKGKALVNFLWWSTHDGEKIATDLSYAPLPPEVIAKVETSLKSISSQGKKLLD